MSKRYRLVVFDWEGTLSDTLGQVFNCVAEEARKLHFGELDKELARQYVELGLVNAIRKVFPDLTLMQHERLLEAVQQSLYTRHGDVYLIPGALDMVQHLHDAGVSLAIATNKGHQSLQRALQLSGLARFFSVTRSASQAPLKPCPQMLTEILEETAISVDDAVMIGDSVTDIEMAQSLGMDSIGVNFYHKHSDVLLAAGALRVFSDYRELAEYFAI